MTHRNPVNYLNEWAQKDRTRVRRVEYTCTQADRTRLWSCRVSVQPVGVVTESSQPYGTKAEAKQDAAAQAWDAVRALPRQERTPDQDPVRLLPALVFLERIRDPARTPLEREEDAMVLVEALAHGLRAMEARI